MAPKPTPEFRAKAVRVALTSRHLLIYNPAPCRDPPLFRSVPGSGPVASAMLVAEMPELGHLSGEQASALTGLAPIAHDKWYTERKASYKRWETASAACDAPHHYRCPPSQSRRENLCRPTSRCRQTSQSHHHGRRSQTGHNRQVPSHMECS
ncbi:transposase [Ruegeria sp. ANG-S4]|uniref:transposase n=1 Tax=Ruegeria sp. ANG-S4 TaxID=1577904 RepID=UPI0009E1BC80